MKYLEKQCNRGNKFKTNTKSNLNTYINELINFTKQFITIIEGENIEFSLQDHKMNSYELPLC